MHDALPLHLGGCLCGGVRYRITQAIGFAEHCHCTMCRKAHGAAFSSNAVVDAAHFELTQGAALVSEYESSAGRRKCFCSRCGSQLFIRRLNRPEVVVVTLGSMDDAPDAKPLRHVFVGSKAPWLDIGDALPQHQVYPLPRDADAPELAFVAAHADDAEPLVALRIAAMRDSLERIGRFDAQRARERFLSGYSPRHTHHVELDGERVGFYVLKPAGEELLLDHLYVHPSHQGRGIGAAVLARVFAQADAARLPVRVGALRDSDSNRFYRRHGFELVGESEFDLHYLRQPAASAMR